MKQPIEKHAERFNNMAAEYDDLERPVYRACTETVIEAAAVESQDVVLDLGAGTGAIALPLAQKCSWVIARDISESMLEEAQSKASASNLTNVAFGYGSFREPAYDGDDVSIITTNYAMHHLDDMAKREAISRIAQFQPDRFVLGDLMFFDEPGEAFAEYNPEFDDPATVGTLAVALTDAGFEITQIEQITDHAGVIVAEAPRTGWPQ